MIASGLSNTREHVATACRRAPVQDLVELPAGRMDLERQALDQYVVLVPGDVGVCRRRARSSRAVVEAKRRGDAAAPPG
jgi:hypothetical protein